jgi:hypothetical protein
MPVNKPSLKGMREKALERLSFKFSFQFVLRLTSFADHFAATERGEVSGGFDQPASIAGEVAGFSE